MTNCNYRKEKKAAMVQGLRLYNMLTTHPAWFARRAGGDQGLGGWA